MPLRLLQVQPHFLTLHKPANLSSQGPGQHVLALLRRQHPELYDVEAPFTAPKSVHRLDRQVCGLMIFARSMWATRTLARQFRDGGVGKEYMALVDPPPQGDSGVITSPVDGKEAVTAWETHGRYLLLKPTTGRKHQLRKHLASIGSPILNDVLYGGPPFNGSGIALQCVSMSFTMGMERIAVEDELCIG